MTCDSSVVFSGTAGVRIKSPSNTIIKKLLYLLFVESKYHKCLSRIWIAQSLVLCVAFYGSLSSFFFFFVVLYFFLFGHCIVCLSSKYDYKKGALDSQPEVIKFTSYLPMVGGSLRILRLLPSLKLASMI